MISVHSDCETPLGLENGEVKASDTQATSTYTLPNEDYSPTLGRLNNKVFNQFGISYKGDNTIYKDCSPVAFLHVCDWKKTEECGTNLVSMSAKEYTLNWQTLDIVDIF